MNLCVPQVAELCVKMPTDATQPLTIGIVVGEASGDILGAGLMRSLRKRYPDACFVGIGGPKMLAEGFQSLFAQDRLAVMGFVEPLARLPELLSIRRQLKAYFKLHRPAVFIGIDSPDFNLGLELSLRDVGLKTVHYVSPSVWAWRQGRVKKIAKAVDLMLTLLPFEADFYVRHNVPVEFVGHPLADEIARKPDVQKAWRELGLAPAESGETVVALLPGSRSGEVARMGAVFLQAAAILCQSHEQIRFIIPSANERRHQQLQEIIAEHGKMLSVILVEGHSHQVMTVADVVLMASGTTTLEAMLLKKPMVIAYKVGAFSYWLFRKLVKVKHIGLPNLLAGRGLVPEFIQDAATPAALAQALEQLLNNDTGEADRVVETFDELHVRLQQNADERAAAAIVRLIGPLP